MEMTPEELDVKLADARKEGESTATSAQESEWQAKVDAAKAEAEKTRSEADRKLGETSKEIGELRKEKETWATKNTELETLRTEKTASEKAKADADAAEMKRKEESEKNPTDQLKALKVTDEEAKQVDALIKSEQITPEMKAQFASDDPKIQDAALVEAVQVLRESGKSVVTDSIALTRLQGIRKSDTTSPESIRSVLSKIIKDEDKTGSKIASINPIGGALGGGTKSPGNDADGYKSFSESLKKK